MDLFIKMRWEKTKYFILFSVTLIFLLLIASYYKNEEVPINKKESKSRWTVLMTVLMHFKNDLTRQENIVS